MPTLEQLAIGVVVIVILGLLVGGFLIWLIDIANPIDPLDEDIEL